MRVCNKCALTGNNIVLCVDCAEAAKFDWVRTAGSTVDQYATLGAEIGKLVTEKQKAYGDSFSKSGEVMRILYPDGVPPEKMDDALCIVRILDKIFRIATDRDALGESPYRDIAGYALLGAKRSQK